MSLSVSYCQIDDLKRLLGRKGGIGTTAGHGTITSGLRIGTLATDHVGTADAMRFINDAEYLIDGALHKKYEVPFGSPIPYEVRWIAARFAVGAIIQAYKQTTANSTSNFSFDKEMMYTYAANAKLENIRDGLENIKGVVETSIPMGTHTTSDAYEFGVPGSIRPNVGM